MDSMVNAIRRPQDTLDDSYTRLKQKTPTARSSFMHRLREAFPDAALVIGASKRACAASALRLLVGQSRDILPDAKRESCCSAMRGDRRTHASDGRRAIAKHTDLRGTAFMTPARLASRG